MSSICFRVHTISSRNLALFVIFCISSAATTHISSALPIDIIFELPSPTPAWPQGEGFGNGRIDLGGLIVSQVSSFNKIWASYEWGPDNLGATFFEPSPIPDGFFMLGGYAQPNNKPLFGWVLVGQDVDGSALKQPVDYTMFWGSNDLGINQHGLGYFWLPIPPDSYKAVGYVVTNSSDKPSLDRIRCVRSDLTDKGELGPWMYSANKLNVFEMRPKNIGVEALGVSVGTFVTLYDWEAPDSQLSLSCLKKQGSNFSSSMPNVDQIEALIQAYAPAIYFHPDEEYLPSSVRWFFSNGALLYNASDEPSPVRVDPDGSNLPEDGSDDDRFWLDLPDDEDERERVMRGDLDNSQAYFHAKPMFGGTFTDIAMWVFYPFNGPARLQLKFLTIPFMRIGSHVGDWEHVTLRISNFNGELLSVYFSQHSGGTWVRAAELEFHDGNRFVAYSSLHGHAFYPCEGLVLQGQDHVGLRNDAAKSGLVMDTVANFAVVAAEYLGLPAIYEPPWINYTRKWGPKITYDIGEEMERIERFLHGKLRSALDKFLASVPSEVLGQEGPDGPKCKSSWDGDEASPRNVTHLDRDQLI